MNAEVVNNPFANLNAIVEEINNSPITQKAAKEHAESDSMQHLCISNSEFTESQPVEYQKLVSKLDEELCGLFIDRKGQNNLLFSRVEPATGHRVNVVERDSFGPLICSFIPKDGDWVVYYG